MCSLGVAVFYCIFTLCIIYILYGEESGIPNFYFVSFFLVVGSSVNQFALVHGGGNFCKIILKIVELLFF